MFVNGSWHYGEGWSENGFLFGASKSVFLACTNFTSCLRLLGTTALFEFILFFISFLFISTHIYHLYSYTPIQICSHEHAYTYIYIIPIHIHTHIDMFIPTCIFIIAPEYVLSGTEELIVSQERDVDLRLYVTSLYLLTSLDPINFWLDFPFLCGCLGLDLKQSKNLWIYSIYLSHKLFSSSSICIINSDINI